MIPPTRILLTADAVGGVWQYATDLARALRPLGYDPVIALLGPPPSEAQRAEAADLHLLDTGLPLDWLSDSPEPVLAAGEAIAHLAASERVELVHLNSPALGAAARFSMPVVAVAHGCIATWWHAANGGEPPSAYRWHVELMRRGLLAADLVVAPTAAFAAELQRAYALPNTPVAVHNGRAPSATAGASRPAGHAFTAGRLWDRAKNTDVLDRAAARLSAPLRAAGATVGPQGEKVSPQNLALMGVLAAEDIAAELATRPVFISAASFEPFGLAVLEAAQAGCALVLSDIPTFRELWNNVALFTPAGNDAAIAAAVEGLLSDASRRDALGGAAQARAGRYTPENVAAHMSGLYAGLDAAFA